MFTVPVYSLKSAMQNENPVIGTMKLPEELVGVPVRKDILHRVVVWQLACKRKGTASVRVVGTWPFNNP
jgi:ribosomal protein L4